ncbi:DUF3558 domain-containing protein [Streptomyces sp. NPDC059009]|uniref:DUF3558 domain-containing protein n=1 Tax=Streptomyces sp. NPDC059009 TaxID=3346694 RepID=UPI00369302CA
MQRKARSRVYVSGVAALLSVVLAGCSGGSGLGDDSDDSKPGDPGSTTRAAEPGKFRTLPEPCGAVDHSTLDELLPGIQQIEDEDQQEKAYAGTATNTFDTDRRVGCRWKVDSPDATHHLLVDYERVVSYDGDVSDDARAQELYQRRVTAADLPAPSASSGDNTSKESTSGDGASDDPGSGSGSASGKDKDKSGDKGKQGDKGEKGGKGGKGDKASPSGSPSGNAAPPASLLPRVLDDLGDEAYLDDALAASGSAARHRTVTVVFRTSNVLVTVEYDEQPGRGSDIPDSKEMQDKAQELAESLAGKFDS